MDATMATIGLNEAVGGQLDFLVPECGLDSAEITDEKIRYSNDTVSVEIRFDRSRSFEIAAHISVRNHTADLAELEELEANLPAEQSFPQQVSTEESLRRAVGFLGDYMRTYCLDILAGETARVVEVEEFAAAKQRDYNKMLRLDRILQTARSAWDEENFQEVVTALEPVESELYPSDLKRLQYSRKKQDEQGR